MRSALDTSRTRAWVREMEIKKRASFVWILASFVKAKEEAEVKKAAALAKKEGYNRG